MEYDQKSCAFLYMYCLAILASLIYGNDVTCIDGELAGKSMILTSDTSNYVRHMLAHGSLITKFTLCMWVKTNSLNTLGTVVHYSTPMQLNAIVMAVGKVQGGTGAFMEIAGKLQIAKILNLELDQWQHVCVAWDFLGSSGVLGIFHNYVKVYTMNLAIPGVVIDGTGPLYLGEQIDDFFIMDPSKSFSGELFSLNIWSRVLSEAEITQMATYCASGCGDVLSWADFTTSDLNDVNIRDANCDVISSTELPRMTSSSPFVNNTILTKESLYMTSKNTAETPSGTLITKASTISGSTGPTTWTNSVAMATVDTSETTKHETSSTEDITTTVTAGRPDIPDSSSSESVTTSTSTPARPDIPDVISSENIAASTSARTDETEISSTEDIIAATTGRPDMPYTSEGFTASTTGRSDIPDAFSNDGIIAVTTGRPDMLDTSKGVTASTTGRSDIPDAFSSDGIIAVTTGRPDMLDTSEGFTASTTGRPDIPDAFTSDDIIVVTTGWPDMLDTISNEGLAASTPARPDETESSSTEGITTVTSGRPDIPDLSSSQSIAASTPVRPDLTYIISSEGLTASTTGRPDVRATSSKVDTTASTTGRTAIPQQDSSTNIISGTAKITKPSAGIEVRTSSFSKSYMPGGNSRTSPSDLTASSSSVLSEFKTRIQPYPTVHTSTLEVSNGNKRTPPTQTSAAPGSCEDDEYSQQSFVFRPNKDTGSYVKHSLLRDKELVQFTLCMWVRANTLITMGTVIHYETIMHTNEIVIKIGTTHRITGVSLIISDNLQMIREVPLQLYKWQHVCIAWESLGSSGVLSIFHNYATVYTMSIPVADVVIQGNGFFTLGDPAHSFDGEIAFLNMWSRILTGREIRNSAKDGANGCGDIIAWTDFKDADFYNVDIGDFKDDSPELFTTTSRVHTSMPSTVAEYSSPAMSKANLLETIINSRPTDKATLVTSQPPKSQSERKASPFPTVISGDASAPIGQKQKKIDDFVGLLILSIIVTILLIGAAVHVTYYAYLEWKKRNRRGHYAVN